MKLSKNARRIILRKKFGDEKIPKKKKSPCPQGPFYQKSYSQKIDKNDVLSINPHCLGMIFAKKKSLCFGLFWEDRIGGLGTNFFENSQKYVVLHIKLKHLTCLIRKKCQKIFLGL